MAWHACGIPPVLVAAVHWCSFAPRRSHRNIDTFESIAQQMATRGHCRTAMECRNKTKVMRAEYRRVVAHNSKSGNSRTTCPYYEQLHNILRGDASMTPLQVARSLHVHTANDAPQAASSGKNFTERTSMPAAIRVEFSRQTELSTINRSHIEECGLLGTDAHANEDPAEVTGGQGPCEQQPGSEAGGETQHVDEEDPRSNCDPAVHNPTATMSPAVHLAALRRKKPKGSRTEVLLLAILEEAKEDSRRRDRAAASGHAEFMTLLKENDVRAEQDRLERSRYRDRVDGIVSVVSGIASSLETLTRTFQEQGASSGSVNSVSAITQGKGTQLTSVPFEQLQRAPSHVKANVGAQGRKGEKASGKGKQAANHQSHTARLSPFGLLTNRTSTFQPFSICS
ncbi:myb/SANT-like DNA-binding domain-containing protein 7 [Rhineura floridana]|uniref:myb/SANT-like DNA-binding domain-containing protein 7 n=1 Tax=Rhineura floridana TaxID=261503 RepID=UPI002AC84CEC|nr:myb/SANT-like DNA-binding domain-containing protein 7 [Rhineura floridana]